MQVVAPRLVPFLPLRALIAFPHEVYPIYIGRGMSLRAVEAAEGRKIPILLVAQRDATVGIVPVGRCEWMEPPHSPTEKSALCCQRTTGRVSGSVWVCRFSGKEYEHGC